MPIRINLLAEAQMAEDLRRRDPVKRATYIGLLLVAMVLAWASVLQARITLQRSQANRLQDKIAKLQTDYTSVVNSQKALAEARLKLAALERLSTNRYLAANLLDALQRAYAADVRVIKFRTDFKYILTEATKPKTNAFTVVEGKPASATEQITVHIEAVDSSANPGDQVNDYKEAVASLEHLDKVFKDAQPEVRLVGLNPPQPDANGRQFVQFTLECNYPETVR